MRSLVVNSILLLILLTVGLTGCQVVGDIFEAGLWVGLVGVVVVVAVIFWIFRKIT